MNLETGFYWVNQYKNLWEVAYYDSEDEEFILSGSGKVYDYTDLKKIHPKILKRPL